MSMQRNLVTFDKFYQAFQYFPVSFNDTHPQSLLDLLSVFRRVKKTLFSLPNLLTGYTEK